MEYTLKELERMKDDDGNLDLRYTNITSLPEGLTVGGALYLSGTNITSLPEGLTVGGSLYLSGTNITSLPEGLTVGGSLYLSDTNITSLPEGLTVGCWLYLSGTNITSLPEGLTVGGSLYLSGTNITNRNHFRKMQNGDECEGKWIYADMILFPYNRKRQIGDYLCYVGKIKGRYLITDGEFYAHCKTPSEGIEDIIFKRAKERGAQQYKGVKLDDSFTVKELMQMYRIITGACRAGSETFINSVRDLKPTYTVAEVIEATHGQYGYTAFQNFFKNKNN